MLIGQWRSATTYIATINSAVTASTTACIEVTHGVTKVRRECEGASMARHACGDEERDI
jgi:hypothetical protein